MNCAVGVRQEGDLAMARASMVSEELTAASAHRSKVHPTTTLPLQPLVLLLLLLLLLLLQLLLLLLLLLILVALPLLQSWPTRSHLLRNKLSGMGSFWYSVYEPHMIDF